MVNDDLISREAAIEAVHKVIFEFFDPCGDDKETPFTEKDKLLLKLNKAISNSVKSLPTAEPDMARAIATIIENEQDMRVIERNAEPRWTPVTERLPEPNEIEHYVRKYYLIQNEYGDMMVAAYHGNESGETWWEQMYAYKPVEDEIVAWMPLPTPWEGESDGR